MANGVQLLVVTPAMETILQRSETTLGENTKDLTTCKTVRGIGCKN